MSDRLVIQEINIDIAQIAIPIKSSASEAGFYACKVGKICRMVIQKYIGLVV